MKLITLNMWGGRIVDPLTDFLKKHSDVDVFLFQEIYEDVDNPDFIETHEKAPIPKILTNHKGYYRPASKNGFGVAAFVKKDVLVKQEGDTFVHGKWVETFGEQWWNSGKNMQYVQIQSAGETYTIFGVHGMWDQSGKSDTPERIEQSKRIVEYIKKFSGNIILCGDFNLRPDTESVKMIERELGLRNLITEYGVTSTRTSLYKKTAERFADYIFVSQNIKVKKFEVMPDEVSDHAALYLEC